MSTITKLAESNRKMDRTRSTLIACSIIMTTLLLTVIVSVGYGIIEMNKSNAADWYGSYYGYMRNVTAEQMDEMSRQSAFTDIGRASFFGMVDMEQDASLVWMDEQTAEMTNAARELTEGHYPKAVNEIAAPPSFFRACGLKNPKIGDKVSVRWRAGLTETFVEDTFLICGFLSDPQNQYSQLNANVSRQFFERKIPEAQRYYTAYFRLDGELKVNTGNVEETMKSLAEECGITPDCVRPNSYFLNWYLDPGIDTIAVCAAIGVIVVLFSVIVIYNIFQVGILQRVHEYGKLKAIGATKKQMKQVLFFEGMSIAAFSVPIGLAAGLICAKLIMRLFVSLMGENVIVSEQSPSIFNLPLLLLAAAVSFATVWAALRKPMRLVASISPVEAMRYLEDDKKKNGIRKGKEELNVWRLTAANLAGHKRRTVSTVVSMGLSCVLFLVIASCVHSMDIAYEVRKFIEYGQFKITLDYSTSDTAYPENNLDHILSDNPLNGALREEILAIPGVTEVREEKRLYTRRLDADGNKGEALYSVRVLSREEFERQKGYYEEMNLGTLDYDTASKEHQLLYGYSYGLELQNEFAIGEELKLSLGDGVENREFQTTLAGSFGTIGATFGITEDTYRSFGFSGEPVGVYWIDCDAADADAVEAALSEILSVTKHVQSESYRVTKAGYVGAVRLMKTGGYLFSMLIAVISFFNMANTMITSMVTRKREFGILQAIGLTNRQLNMSLQLEGIVLVLGTVFVAIGAGLPLGYAMFRYAKGEGIMGLNVYHFPVTEVLAMLMLLALMQGSLSFVLTKNVKKESLVERIRYQE